MMKPKRNWAVIELLKEIRPCFLFHYKKGHEEMAEVEWKLIVKLCVVLSWARCAQRAFVEKRWEAIGSV